MKITPNNIKQNKTSSLLLYLFFPEIHSPRHPLALHMVVKVLSRVWLFATDPVDHSQATPSMGLSRQEYWSIPVVAISFSRGSSPARDQTPVSHVAGRHFTLWATNTTLCTWLGKYKNYISQPPLQLTVVMWQDSGQWGTRYRDKCNFQVMTLKGQDMPFSPPPPLFLDPLLHPRAISDGADEGTTLKMAEW